MEITVVNPTATSGFVTQSDLRSLDVRLQVLSDRLTYLLEQVENLRDRTSPVEWDSILHKPLASLEAAGLIRLDSFYDSESETTGASLWVVKKLLTQVQDLVLETRKINGKPLDKDIVLTYKDVGTMSKADFDQKTHSVNLDGFVPKTTTINGKPLSGNVTLTYEDIGGSSWKYFEGLLDTYFNDYVTWDMTINGTKIKDMPSNSLSTNHLGYAPGNRSPAEADYTYNGLLFFPNVVSARIANTVSIPPGSYQSSNYLMVNATIWDYDSEVVNERLIRKDWTINGIPMTRDNGGINFTEKELPGFCLLSEFQKAFDARVAMHPPVQNLTFKDRKLIEIVDINTIPKGYVITHGVKPTTGDYPKHTVEIGIPYCVLADGSEVIMEMID